MFQPKYLKNQARYDKTASGVVSYFKSSFKRAKKSFLFPLLFDLRFQNQLVLKFELH